MSLDNEMDQMVRGNELSSLRATVAHLTGDLQVRKEELDRCKQRLFEMQNAAINLSNQVDMLTAANHSARADGIRMVATAMSDGMQVICQDELLEMASRRNQ